MGWEVRWTVVDGPNGARDPGEHAVVLQNETVRFTLVAGRDMTAHQVRDAERSMAWSEQPTLQVVGADTGTRGEPVRSSDADPLRLRYRFQYTGPKRLSFTGRPGTLRPEYNPYTRHAVTTTAEPGFPALSVEMRLEVLSEDSFRRRYGTDGLPGETDADLPVGRLGATAGDSTRRRRHAERDRTRREEAEETADAEELRLLQEARAAILARRGRVDRPGLLVMDGEVLGEAELDDMTRAEAEDYLTRFNNAYRATPVLDLNNETVTYPGGIQVEFIWVIDSAGGEATVYQRPTHFWRLGREVMLADVDEVIAQVRRNTSIHFSTEDYLVVILPGDTRRAVLSGSQLLSHEWDRLIGLLEVVAEFVAFEFLVIRPLTVLLRGVFRAIRFVGGLAAARGLLGRAGMRVFGDAAGSAAGRVLEGGMAAGRVLEDGSAAGRLMEDAAAGERAGARAAPETPPASSPEARAAGDAEARGTGEAARGTGPEASGVAPGAAAVGEAPGTAIVLRDAVPLSAYPLPEEALGYSRSQLNLFRRIFGVPLTDSRMAVVGDLWNATLRRSERVALAELVARGGDAGTINDAARAIFDRVRGRFWRAVRRSPEAMRIFREAGFSFPEEFVRDLGASLGAPVPRSTLSGLRSSPPFLLPANPPPEGSPIMFLDIDHMMRLSDRPNLCLSDHNLRLVSRLENQAAFESLRRMDSFGGAVSGGLRRGRRALITPPPGSAPLDTAPPDWDELMRQLDAWMPGADE